MHALRKVVLTGLFILSLYSDSIRAVTRPTSEGEQVIFSFFVTSDIQGYAGGNLHTDEYFLGACRAMARLGPSSFMVSTGLGLHYCCFMM